MAANASGVDFDHASARRQIDRAAKKLRKHADKLLEMEQKLLRDRIVQLVPVDSGTLLHGVFVDVVLLDSGPVLVCGVHDVPYAVYVEFGTKDTPAQPFLRVAIAEMPGYIKRGAR